MKKRFAVLMLLVCAVLCWVCVAQAETTVSVSEYSELLTKLGSATSGTTIEFSGTIPGSTTNNTPMFTVPAGVTLHITSSASVETDSKLARTITVVSGATLQLDADLTLSTKYISINNSGTLQGSGKVNVVINKNTGTVKGNLTINTTLSNQGGRVEGDIVVNGKLQNQTMSISGEKYVGTVTGGTFNGEVTNQGSISGGTFTGNVSNTAVGSGTISGGTFTSTVTNYSSITGGTFYGSVEDESSKYYIITLKIDEADQAKGYFGTETDKKYTSYVLVLKSTEGDTTVKVGEDWPTVTLADSSKPVRGWCDSENGEHTTGIDLKLTGDITLTAVFDETPQITLDANGGKFADGKPTKTIDYTENFDWDTVEKPTREGSDTCGYTFDGWYVDSECLGDQRFDPNNSSVVIPEELYAGWDEFDECNVVFDAGTTGTVVFNEDVDFVWATNPYQASLSVKYNEKIANGDIPRATTTEDGKVFKYWTKDRTNSNNPAEFDFSQTITDQTLTLNAVWGDAITVTIDLGNGGTFGTNNPYYIEVDDYNSAIARATVAKGTTYQAVVDAATITWKEGYSFSHYTNEDGNKLTLSNAIVVPEYYNACTIYAQYNKASDDYCMLKFDNNNENAVGTIPPFVVKKGEEKVTVKLPTPGDYVRDQGEYYNNLQVTNTYNESEDGLGKAYNGAGSYTFTPNEDVTLYVMWMGDTSRYNAGVTYNDNNGKVWQYNGVAGFWDNTSYQENATHTLVELTDDYVFGNNYTPPEGQKFKGYTRNADGTGTLFQVGDGITVPKTGVTVYAQWEPETYTVTLDPNGGSYTSDIEGWTKNTDGTIKQTVNYKHSYTDLPTPTRTDGDYDFLGWYIGTSDGAKDVDLPYTVTDNVTLVAQWRKMYTIKVEVASKCAGMGTADIIGHDGGGSLGNQVRVPAQEMQWVRATPEENFEFDHWEWNASSVVISDPENRLNKVRVDENYPDEVIFTAYFKLKQYGVTLDANGGKIADGESKVDSKKLMMDYGHVLEQTDVASYTPSWDDGKYNFAGWYTAADGGTKVTFDETAGKSSITVTDNVTLYAHWNYTISFEANGGSGTMDAITKDKGTNATIPTCGFTRDDYQFTGWKVENGTTTYQPNATYPSDNGNVTLVAQWLKLYNIKAEVASSCVGMGTVDVSDGSVSVGTSVALPAGRSAWIVATPAENYEFDKWVITGTSITESESTDVYYLHRVRETDQNTVTFTAHFKLKKYGVTLDPNGGWFLETGETRSQTLQFNYGYTLKKTDVEYYYNVSWPLNKYDFTGWYTADGTKVTFDETTGVSNITVTGNVTLYAHWNYTVTFDSGADDTTGATEPLTIEKGKTGVLPECGFTRSGYRFTGWKVKNDTTTSTTYQPGATYSSDNGKVTLVAQWERVYTIKVEVVGGDANCTAYLKLDPEDTKTYYPEVQVPVGTTKLYVFYTLGGGYLVHDMVATNGSCSETEDGWYRYTIPATGLQNDTITVSFGFPVTFYGNGGAFGNRSDMAFTRMKDYELMDTDEPSPLPTRTDGLTFAGWYTGTKGGSQVILKTDTSDGSNNTVTGPTDIYAHWKYTVKFEPGATDAEGMMAAQVIDYNGDTTLNECSFTRDNCSFAGWKIEGGDDTIYADKAEFFAANADGTGVFPFKTGTVTLVAQWTYTVKAQVADDCSSMGTVAICDDKEQKLGTSASVPAGTKLKLVATPAEEYIEFDYWSWDVNSDIFTEEQAKAAEIEYTVSESVTFTAHFKLKKYGVTLDANGGKFTDVDPAAGTKTQKFDYGHVLALKDVAYIPQWNDSTGEFIFAGWYTAADGGDEVTFDETKGESSITVGEEGVTLYAHWNYTVTFDANGGTGEPMPNKTVAKGESIKLPKCTYEKTGSVLDGWKIDGDSTLYTDEASFTSPKGNVTLKAQWTDTCTVEVVEDENSTGSGSAIIYLSEADRSSHTNGATTVQVRAGSKVYLQATADEDSNFIKYWWRVDGAEQTAETADAEYTVGSTGKTIYARFDLKSYTVTFDTDGGTAVEPKTINHGEAIGTAPTTTKEGSTFKGWYEKDAEDPYDFTQLVNADVTLYAHWEENTEPTTEPTEQPTAEPTEVPATATPEPTATTTPAPTAEPIVILQQPQDTIGQEGQQVDFSVTAKGDGLSYQWYVDRNDGKGFVPCENGSSATHTTTPLKRENDGYRYYCEITSNGESLRTDTVTLTVEAAVPKTGDNAHLGLWLTMMAMSLASMAFILHQRKQNN